MNTFEFPASPAEYVDYRNETELFESMAAFVQQPATLTGNGDPERLQAAGVTASLWELLRVKATKGRTFDAEEDRPGANPVAVISHGLWQRRFGGDPAILGRSLTLDGETRAFAVAFGLSLLVGLCCGVLPALRASGGSLASVLRSGGQRVASGGLAW